MQRPTYTISSSPRRSAAAACESPDKARIARVSPTDEAPMVRSLGIPFAIVPTILLLCSMWAGAGAAAALGTHGLAPPAGPALAPVSRSVVPLDGSIAATSVPLGPIMTSNPVKQVAADPLNTTFVLLSSVKVGQNLTGLLRIVSDRTFDVVDHHGFSENGSPNMTLDAATGEVYITDLNDSVSVFSGANLRLITNISTSPLARLPLYDPGNGDIYVAHACPYPGVVGTTDLTVIDGGTNTVVASVRVPCDPTAMVADASNGNLFLLTGPAGNLTVISGTNQSVLATVPDVGGTVLPGASPKFEMIYDPVDGDVFVSCLTSGFQACVSVVNGTTGGLVHTVDATGTMVGPFAVDPRGNVVYVAGFASNGLRDMTLFVVSGSRFTVSPVTSLGCFADSLSTDPTNDVIYALGNCGGTAGTPGTLFMLSATTYAIEASLLAAPHALFEYANTLESTAVDPVTGDVLTAFAAPTGGSVVTIFGPFPVTFSTTVDALGLNWTASLTFPSGYVDAAFTEETGLTFWVPNGSYDFALRVPGDYWASPSSGTVGVQGAPAALHATVAWAWWGWAVLVLSSVALLPGAIAARRARASAREWKELAAARLRWDLEHPLVPPADAPGTSGPR